MKTFKQFCYLSEEGGAPAMSVGPGFQGLGSAQGAPIAGYDKILGNGKMLRRRALEVLRKKKGM